jgi:hypothetical protein
VGAHLLLVPGLSDVPLFGGLMVVASTPIEPKGLAKIKSGMVIPGTRAYPNSTKAAKR